MVDGLKISAQRDQGSLLRELRVAASAAGHAIPVLREEHARPALRTVRPLPRDAIPVDLVELPLESRDALFLLRLDLRFDQLVADEDVLALDREGLLLRLVDLRVADGLVSAEGRGLRIDDHDVLRRLQFAGEERAERVAGRRRLRLVDRFEGD